PVPQRHHRRGRGQADPGGRPLRQPGGAVRAGSPGGVGVPPEGRGEPVTGPPPTADVPTAPQSRRRSYLVHRSGTGKGDDLGTGGRVGSAVPVAEPFRDLQPGGGQQGVQVLGGDVPHVPVVAAWFRQRRPLYVVVSDTKPCVSGGVASWTWVSGAPSGSRECSGWSGVHDSQSRVAGLR